MAEVAFWNSLRKKTAEYVQNCPIYQKKEKYRKTGLEGEMRRPKEI